MALASCNSPKSAGENPFFTQWDTPFGVPPFDKIRAEHFMPAFERGMSLHEAEIDAITSNNDEPRIRFWLTTTPDRCSRRPS